MGTVFTMYNAVWLVDLWEPDGQKIREQLAYTKCFACADAAYGAALDAHPFDRITFRHGARVIQERPASRWTSEAAEAAKAATRRRGSRRVALDELPALLARARMVADACRARALLFHRGVYREGIGAGDARAIDEQELALAAHLLAELCVMAEAQAERLETVKAEAGEGAR